MADRNELLARMARTRVNRRGFMAAAGLGGLSAYLAACSAPGGGSGNPSAAPGGSSSGAPTQTEGALYMYNWGDYVDEGNIEAFKSRFGVTDFKYDVYASNEELLAKLQGGAVGLYDVGAPTAEFVPTMVEQGFLQKIDWSKVPNGSLINPQFKKQWWDPNDEYQLPKDWGTTGIALRSKIVTEDVKTWKDFFDLAPKYSGKIVVVDSMGDVLTAPLKALGYSLNSNDPGELEEARKLLMELAPHVLALDSDNYNVKLQTEEAVMGITWTGGVVEMRDEPETADTKYIVPEDGTLYWMDTWVIFADAPHPEAAHAFLNFIHEPEIQAQETITNRYATPNDEAKKLVPQEILDDQTVFVPEEAFSRLEGAEDTSTDENRLRIWEEFRSSIGQG